MLLSTTPKRLIQCYIASRFHIIEKFVGNEVVRIIAPSGIEYIGATKEEFDILCTLIPSNIRAKTPSGLDSGRYKFGNYTLDVLPGELKSISHKLLLSKKLS